MRENSAVFRPKYIWSRILLVAGWGAFWLAGIAGEKLPVVAVFVGPAIMAVALVLLSRNRKYTR